MPLQVEVEDGSSAEVTAASANDRALGPPDIEQDEQNEPSLPVQLGRFAGMHRRELEDECAFEPYFPPTDPVLLGGAILGGFSHTSMDLLEVESSALDGQVGDEALAEAVRRELHLDAATSAFDIDVTVEDRIAYLRGIVTGLEDVEALEEVASRLSQLFEVVDQLEIIADGRRPLH